MPSHTHMWLGQPLLNDMGGKKKSKERGWLGLGAAPVACFNKPLGDSDVNESEGTPVVAYPFLKRT